jgi:hypothetical protein
MIRKELQFWELCKSPDYNSWYVLKQWSESSQSLLAKLFALMKGLSVQKSCQYIKIQVKITILNRTCLLVLLKYMENQEQSSQVQFKIVIFTCIFHNWTIQNGCRDNPKKIWLDRTHSTEKSKRNLPQHNGTHKAEDHVDNLKPPGGAQFWRNVGSFLQNWEMAPETYIGGS